MQAFRPPNWVLPILSEIKEFIARSFVVVAILCIFRASELEYLSMLHGVMVVFWC